MTTGTRARGGAPDVRRPLDRAARDGRRADPHRSGPPRPRCSTSAVSPSRPLQRWTRDIDCVLLSHLHPDHLDPAVASQTWAGELDLALRSARAACSAAAASRTCDELAPGDSADVGAAQIEAFAVEPRRTPTSARAVHVQALGYEVRSGATVCSSPATPLHSTLSAHHRRRRRAAADRRAGAPTCGPSIISTRAPPPKPQRRSEPETVVPIHWGTMLRAGLENRKAELLDRAPRRSSPLRWQSSRPGVDTARARARASRCRSYALRLPCAAAATHRPLSHRPGRDLEPGAPGAARRDRQLVRAPPGQAPRRRARGLRDGLELRAPLPQRAHDARASSHPSRRASRLRPALRPGSRRDALGGARWSPRPARTSSTSTWAARSARS